MMMPVRLFLFALLLPTPRSIRMPPLQQARTTPLPAAHPFDCLCRQGGSFARWSSFAVGPSLAAAGADSHERSLRCRATEGGSEERNDVDMDVEIDLVRDGGSSAAEDDGDGDGAVEDVLVAMIQWYKDTLSPLMQPRCRFYPTCSSYGIASIKEFGPARGLVLTAWRILRCNPFGGKGYDPPVWPPPFWFAGEKMSRALFDEESRRATEEVDGSAL